MTALNGSTVLVTGANGGLGAEFVAQALERGAVKAYASARTPRSWDDTRVVPLHLDVTDPASISAAANTASDATIIINNAGITRDAPIVTGDSRDLRDIFETNFFGAVDVARAFAPILARNGGGAFINVHSVLSWIGLAGAYSASKAAFWSATNSMRLELADQGTRVLGLHLGYAETGMTAHLDVPKLDPADVVRDALDGLESGKHEVLADDLSAVVKSRLAGPISEMYPQFA